VPVRKIEKPSGWLVGRLYDECSKYSPEPASEIGRIASLGLQEGYIGAREYDILQYRIPFPGSERKTLKQLGEGIGLTASRIRQLENKAAGKLLRHYIDDLPS
jgi:hypothetical protein